MVAESKAIKMALLHDLCESLTFDIDKRHVEEMGKAAEELKDKVEREAMRRILAELPDERMAREYAALREEMSEGKSFEARVVCAADCLDILLQLMDYERMGYSKKMFDDFWRDTMKRIHALKVSVASLLADELGKRR
jgi:5'-deoxynucleotidase YfbR-like HD superfamily hydrolase